MQIIPEAVVVDTRDGFTWSYDKSGVPFTTETAKAWVRVRHGMLIEEYQTLKVFVLPQAPEEV